MHEGHGDFAHTARRAIVNKLYRPYGATRRDVLPSVLERDEITDFLIGSFPASWACNLCDARWTNSDRVHHPDNHEIFAAFGAGSNKLIVHKAFFLRNVKARNDSSGE